MSVKLYYWKLTTASNILIKAEELYKEYDKKLKTARVHAQIIVAKSEKEILSPF